MIVWLVYGLGQTADNATDETPRHQDTKAPRKAREMNDEDRVAREVVDAAFRIHRALGPGLLEAVYERCLRHELDRRQLPFQSQVSLPIRYDGISIDDGLRMDLVVAGKVVIELKAVEQFHPVHFSQLLTYLKLSGIRLGLLINFNVPLIKDGIRRLVL
jgi:GxxExxY protein